MLVVSWIKVIINLQWKSCWSYSWFSQWPFPTNAPMIWKSDALTTSTRGTPSAKKPHNKRERMCPLTSIAWNTLRQLEKIAGTAFAGLAKSINGKYLAADSSHKHHLTITLNYLNRRCLWNECRSFVSCLHFYFFIPLFNICWNSGF